MMRKNSFAILVSSAVVACTMIAMPLKAQESNCPDPVLLCALYHPGSVFTTGCEGPLCFSKSYGEAVTVIATDDRGFFTTVWNLWSAGELVADVPGAPCDLRANGSQKNDNKLDLKYKISIPDDSPLPGCRVEVYQDDYVYHEHFGANPATGCLGWAECRLWIGTQAEKATDVADDASLSYAEEADDE